MPLNLVITNQKRTKGFYSLVRSLRVSINRTSPIPNDNFNQYTSSSGKKGNESFSSAFTSGNVDNKNYSNLARSHSNKTKKNCNVQTSRRYSSATATLPPLNSELRLIGSRDANWFTGLRPLHGVCPGVDATGTLYSIPQLSFAEGVTSRQQLQAYFDNTWTLTEVLMGALQGEEAFMVPPYHDLRHPMIFYYGHPAALYINKLRVAGLLKDPINPYFEVVFETGVDEMSWDDLSKNKMQWPSVAQVHQYRRQVYTVVSDLIASLSDEQLSCVNSSSPLWALVMSFEHERIHLETSSFLIAELPLKYVSFPRGFPPYHPSATALPATANAPQSGTDYPINDMLAVDAREVSIGKPRDFPSFGWDNEYGHRTFALSAFRASRFKVTNGEFLEFVRDGGYARNEWWSTAGWEWRAFRNVKWPTFWQRKGPQGVHEYDLRLIFDVVPMQWDWPVCVNLHEAEAFAKWKSSRTSKPLRVLSELEHRAIRDPVASEPLLDNEHVAVRGGNDMMHHGYNTNLACSSMSPVTALPPNALGFHDVFGNAWEWTLDKFCALPGFEVHPLYEDFSTPCFDGLHNVIQGGSFISTGNEASVHSRYHFRPHFHQHASFRLVEQSPELLVTSDTDAPGPYVGSYPFRRSSKAMTELLGGKGDVSSTKRNLVISKHFGGDVGVYAENSNVSSVPFARVKELVLQFAGSLGVDCSRSNIIEVGCGPGGLVFQLAKHFHSVIGVDHDGDLVGAARSALETGRVEYFLRGEGESKDVRQVDLLPNCFIAKHVEFRFADPMSLPAEMSGFDAVVISDVIDKVSSPNSVLGRLGGMRGLVRSGGLLLVSSAYQWSETTTPRSLWLGGFHDPKTGLEVRSREALVQRLSGEFDLLHAEQVSVFWRESLHDIRGQRHDLTVFRRK